ncbi:hypothetical protein ACF3MZ_29675 [Paenibacillaceae bacterium WGS1546]|uniref:hypothetical protein n=1 Tax=Cohnella sp. WGS1546 TaxID=3366810 RepID=UPI00372D21F4
MWLGKEWTEELASRTAKQLLGFLRIETIREGVRLYQSGNVRGGEWRSTNVFTAIVRDTGEDCKTSVQVDFLPFSRCGCGTHGSCSHMAAVYLFAMYDQGIQVQEFLRKHGFLDAATPSPKIQFQETVRQTASAATDGARELPQTARTQTVEKPSPHNGYRKWHRIFQEAVPTYRGAESDFHSFVDRRIIRLADEWDNAERRAWYQLHGWLYALKLGDVAFRKNWNYWSIGQQITSSAMNSMETAIHELVRSKTYDQEEARNALNDFLTVLSESMFLHEYPAVDWLYLYRFLTMRLIRNREMAERERLRIEAKDLAAAAEEARTRQTAAVAHLLLIEQGDRAAIAYLDEHWRQSVGLFFIYPRSYAQNREWERVRAWLEWLRPGSAKDNELAEVYMELWEEIAPQMCASAEIKKLRMQELKRLLPASFETYTQLLLREQEYRQWVDIHMAQLEDLYYSDGFRTVEAKSPESLLPYFHIQADLWVGKKNRHGYQNAISHLYVLKKLYTKIKQTEKWDNFITRFAARYSRLKALQEELRRSEFIP